MQRVRNGSGDPQVHASWIRQGLMCAVSAVAIIRVINRCFQRVPGLHKASFSIGCTQSG
jgi:hypothetical protein